MTGTVVSVKSGNTIRIHLVDTDVDVRLLGISVPSLTQGSKQLKHIAQESKERMESLFDVGSTIYLETDVEEYDSYGRLLAYAYTSSSPSLAVMANAILLEEGLAHVSVYAPNDMYDSEFQQKQDEAMEAGLGLWGDYVDNEASTVVNELIQENSHLSPITAPHREASPKPQGTPHMQEFPSEYFTGADISIHMSDTSGSIKWVEEISAINFRLFEQVRPIYGYNSFVFDQLVRGNRLIQGQFRIPFRKPGYLEEVLGLHETHESGLNPENIQNKERILKEYPELSQGDTGVYVEILQKELEKQGFVSVSPEQGTYCPITVIAVVDAQRAYGLASSGKVDQALWEHLINIDWLKDLGTQEQADFQQRRRAPYVHSFFKTPFRIQFNYGNRPRTNTERPLIREIRDIYLFAKTHWVGYEQGRVADDVYEFMAKDMVPEYGERYSSLTPMMNR